MFNRSFVLIYIFKFSFKINGVFYNNSSTFSWWIFNSSGFGNFKQYSPTIKIMSLAKTPPSGIQKINKEGYKVQFVAKFGFSDLSRINHPPKQINTGSLAMLPVSSVFCFPPLVNPLLKKNQKRPLKHVQCCLGKHRTSFHAWRISAGNAAASYQ